jgi:hypothetical protein
MCLSHDIRFAYRVHTSLSAEWIYCLNLTSAKLTNVSSGVRGVVVMARDRLDSGRFVQICEMKKKKKIRVLCVTLLFLLITFSVR